MGTFFIVAALVFIAVDLFIWVQGGQWDGVTLMTLLADFGIDARPRTPWSWANGTLLWLLLLPMWTWCLVLGLIFRLRGAR